MVLFISSYPWYIIRKFSYEIQKEMNEMTAKNYENKECMYCSGKGYFQLLLGGSETCSCCGGTGKKKE
jgi:RecJ-like exonuclease